MLYYAQPLHTLDPSDAVWADSSTSLEWLRFEKISSMEAATAYPAGAMRSSLIVS